LNDFIIAGIYEIRWHLVKSIPTDITDKPINAMSLKVV